MNTKNLLTELSNSYGISGQEQGVQAVLKEWLKDIGEVTTDHNGNLFCKVCDNKSAAKRVVLDAHLDEIGFVVTSITDEGFVKIAPVGGVDRRLLLSSQLVILAKKGPVKGIVSCIAPHLSEKAGDEPIKIEDMFLDIGYNKAEAEKLVQEGDFVCFDTEATPLLNDFLTGKSLDNRAGCAVVLLAGKLAKEKGLKDIDLTLVFSSKEEVNAAGAKTAAYQNDPTHAIVVDVSFAKAPGVEPKDCGEITKGPMVGFSPVLNRVMAQEFVKVAQREKIPYQREIMSGRTGTNAEGYLLNMAGAKTAVVSVPLKNMHSQIEVVSIADIEKTAELIAVFLEKGAF